MKTSLKNKLIAALVMMTFSFLSVACADSNSDQSGVLKYSAEIDVHAIPLDIERKMIAAVITARRADCSICRFGKKTGDFEHVYPPQKVETDLGYTVVFYRVTLDSTTIFTRNVNNVKRGQSYPSRSHATFGVLWDNGKPTLAYKDVFESYILEDLTNGIFPGIQQEIAASQEKGYTLPNANNIAMAYMRQEEALALFKK